MINSTVAPLDMWKVTNVFRGRKDIEAVHTGSLGPNARNEPSSLLLVSVPNRLYRCTRSRRRGLEVAMMYLE